MLLDLRPLFPVEHERAGSAALALSGAGTGVSEASRRPLPVGGLVLPPMPVPRVHSRSGVAVLHLAGAGSATLGRDHSAVAARAARRRLVEDDLLLLVDA